MHIKHIECIIFKHWKYMINKWWVSSKNFIVTWSKYMNLKLECMLAFDSHSKQLMAYRSHEVRNTIWTIFHDERRNSITTNHTQLQGNHTQLHCSCCCSHSPSCFLSFSFFVSLTSLRLRATCVCYKNTNSLLYDSQPWLRKDSFKSTCTQLILS